MSGRYSGIPKIERRTTNVKAYLSGSESSSDEGSDVDMTLGMRVIEKPRRISDMPADYFAIVKATRFLSHGRQGACVAALSSMQEYDLLNPLNLTALCEEDSLEKLVNMCEVNHLRCRAAALLLLRKITKNRNVAVATVNLGIVPVCVDRLKENALDIMESAASIVSNVGHLRRASKALRRVGGIPVLISHLNVNKEILVAPEESLQTVERNLVTVCRCAADALWVVSRFNKNKMTMLKTGILPIVSTVLLSGNSKVSIPISGILSECSSLLMFQVAIETEGLVGVLLDNMKKGDARLTWSSASALMRAADGCETVRHMVREHGGLELVVRLLRDGLAAAAEGSQSWAAALLGAFWKSAVAVENVDAYQELGANALLIRFIDDTDAAVKIHAVGGLAEMAKTESSRTTIVKTGVLSKIVSMLIDPNPDLVARAAQCLGRMALHSEGMEIIEDHDGVRLLWSLLRNRHRKVQIQALWAIKPTVTRAKNSGEVIRELTGALELLVKLLNSTDVEVLTPALAVVGEVALDYENLSVMTEQGVVRHLSHIAQQGGDDAMRRELCSAIANCCYVRDNLGQFGRTQIIQVVSGFLSTKCPTLLAQACRCFYILSRDPINCIVMHGCGIVPCLLAAIESCCPVTQISAAGCLANIRRVLLKSDYRRAHDKCKNFIYPSVNISVSKAEKKVWFQKITR